VGDFEAAHRVLDEGLFILQSHSSVLGNSITMSYDLGDLAYFEGHYDLAQKYYEEALSWANRKGLPGPADWAKVRLGYLFLQKSELENANLFFQQALPSFMKYGNKYGVVFALEGFAGLVVARRQWEKAIRLFASITRQRKKMQFQRPPVEQIFIDHQLAAIHSQLDRVSFEKVWNEGSALALDKAIVIALEESG
jgi:tetratricopeptide (TPR) repeat protein